MSIEFKKYDEGKLRYELIPPSVLESLAKVLTHGATKYGDNNWKQCKELERLWGGVFRHIQAHRMGETKDPDSGHLHLEHALCSLMMIFYLERDKA